jgi:hypothetical protein
MLRALGLLADLYPSAISNVAPKIGYCFYQTLEKQSKQIESRLVEGTLLGLSRFFNQFSKIFAENEFNISVKFSKDHEPLILLYKFTIAAITSTEEKTFSILKGKRSIQGNGV